MDWTELNKTRVIDLREMMKEHLPEVTGITVMKKDQLIALLAEKLGIEAPRKVVTGVGKGSIKSQIRDLKVKREAALEAKDAQMLRRHRRAIHRLKRRMRRAQKLV